MALTVSHLSKAYGGVEAVRDVSFAVDAGEMVAIIGPNGAGKTTCFNMLNGQLRPDSGDIRLDGASLAGLAPHRIWRLGVGRTFQVTATFGSMSVRENVQAALLSHHRRNHSMWSRAAPLYAGEADTLLERVGMREQAPRPCAELAYGDLKRVELAVALANRPRLLLMDEPTAGMAPEERGALMALAAGLAREDRVAVLFTEHDMNVVFGFATRVVVLHLGEVIAAGPPDRSAPTLGCARCTLATLEVRKLSAGYGRARVLFDLDLEVREGEVVALLGRNGAGKSTTLKAIMGLVAPTAGEISFEKRKLNGLEPYQIARLGLGYVPEDRRIFTDLTVAENLEVGRQPPRAGAPAWTDDRLFALFPALAPLRERRGARMSGGEQQMLCIARTLAGNPRAILLDEPSEGLAPVVVEQVARAVVEMKQAGVAVLLAEQSRHFTERVADRLYVLETGIIRKP